MPLMSEPGGDDEHLCLNCGGSGQEIVGENRVTRDMAIDAGDINLEGSFHSYAYDTCSSCGGTGLPGSSP